MQTEKIPYLLKEQTLIESEILGRTVTLDFFIPTAGEDKMSLLLINDGQDLEKMGMELILDNLYSANRLSPVLCVGIHAGTERKQEYGTAGIPDFAGRGSRAANYARFIFAELLPYVHWRMETSSFKEYAFAGFSLGGLSAMDIVWNHPGLFSIAGVFSGSFWWRNLDQDDPLYNDDTSRIMHAEIREGAYAPGLRFFFECGGADETKDRNHNGVIDSIDDTMDLIHELVAKGYREDKDIRYYFIEEGRHDVATWGLAMPEFLSWAFNPDR